MVKIGSRVKFISDTGVGIVRSIKGELAYVEVDGFEIPALLTDIVAVDISEEAEAIVRIGPDSGRPALHSSRASQSSKSASSGSSGENTVRVRPNVRGSNYGRISIVDDLQSDEPEIDIDLAKIRQNYNKQTTANILAENNRIVTAKAAEKAPFEVTDFELKLAFVPVVSATSGHTAGVSNNERPETADLDAYIVNDSSYNVYYNVAVWRGSYVETISSGVIEADTKMLLKRFSRASLAQVIMLRVSVLPFKATSFVPQRVEGFDIELHPLKFVRPGSYSENDFFDQPSVVFTLATSEIAQIISSDTSFASSPQITTPIQNSPIKKQVPTPGITSVKSDNKTQVIDLHAEELLDNFENMSTGEILQAQLSRFTIALDGALKNGEHGKMVFIHGVGKGKLKHEIKKILDRTYSKLRYQDASFQEYGYGAIMVFI